MKFCREIAKRLGPDVEQKFTEGRSQHRVKYLCEKSRERYPDMPTYEEMKTVGIFKHKCPGEHVIGFKAFRDNPQANPLKTPSGKIEIYSESLAEIAKTWQLAPDDVIDPLPIYTEGFESR